MEKLMRNAPSIVVLIAMAIQVPRVSTFGKDIGAGILAPVFAVFLGVSIYVLSYWHGRTEYKITATPEERAKLAQQTRIKSLQDDLRGLVGFWLTLFVIIEGLLNLAETLTHISDVVLFLSWQWFGAFAYGIFPTLAAFGMGSIQAKLDKLPHGVANASALEVAFNAAMRRIAKWMDDGATQETQSASQGASPKSQDAKPSRNQDAYPKPCPNGCGASLKNANAFSAHFRYCPKRNAQASPNQFLIPINKSDSKFLSQEENKDKTS